MEEQDRPDAADVLQMAVDRLAASKCATPLSVELKPARPLWAVRFEHAAGVAATEWQIDERTGPTEPAPCTTAPDSRASEVGSQLVRALRVALPIARKRQDPTGVYGTSIDMRDAAWHVRFSRTDKSTFGGGVTVVVDAKSFDVVIVRLSQ